jgi:hypothetical protein
VFSWPHTPTRARNASWELLPMKQSERASRFQFVEDGLISVRYNQDN